MREKHPAKLITRLIEPTAGLIRVGGQDITKARGKALRPVYRADTDGVSVPAGSFDPRKTIGYGIGESLANHACPERSGSNEWRNCWSSAACQPNLPGVIPMSQRWPVSAGGHCPGPGHPAEASDLR